MGYGTGGRWGGMGEGMEGGSEEEGGEGRGGLGKCSS